MARVNLTLSANKNRKGPALRPLSIFEGAGCVDELTEFAKSPGAILDAGAPWRRRAKREWRALREVLGVLDCLFTRFNLGDLGTGLIFGALHVVIRLQIQPELMRRAEKTRETKRCVRTDAAPTARDLIDTRRRDIQGARKSIARQFERNHELLEQLLTWMNWLQFLGHHITPLVVIHYLNVSRTLRRPHEADAPLVINANAMLPFSVPIQCFKPVPWGRRQILQKVGRIQLSQLAARDCFDVHKTRYSPPRVQSFRVAALERLDSHMSYTISIRDIAQPRYLVRDPG